MRIDQGCPDTAQALVFSIRIETYEIETAKNSYVLIIELYCRYLAFSFRASPSHALQIIYTLPSSPALDLVL